MTAQEKPLRHCNSGECSLAYLLEKEGTKKIKCLIDGKCYEPRQECSHNLPEQYPPPITEPARRVASVSLQEQAKNSMSVHDFMQHSYDINCRRH